jgi:small neutral amino acid transporter SnatA (MarC family)
MDQSYGTPDYGTPIPPYEEQPAKKSNTQMIIIIVVLVVLVCCCCLISSLGFLWYFGDSIVNQFTSFLGFLPV